MHETRDWFVRTEVSAVQPPLPGFDGSVPSVFFVLVLDGELVIDKYRLLVYTPRTRDREASDALST